jgi:cobaltochelatase CobS
MIAYKRAPNALSYSLDRALTLRAEPAQREAIHRIAKDVFGDAWGD